MSQNDYTIANQSAPSFRADLNLALQALASQSSGATAPATTYANMMWYDTGNNILKMRSEADDAWIDIGTLDQSTNTFTPSGDAIPSPASPVDGDLLVRSGGAWARLPKGTADQVLTINAGATALEWAEAGVNLANLTNPTAGDTVRFQDPRGQSTPVGTTATYYGFSPAGEGEFRLKISIGNVTGNFHSQALIYRNGVLVLTLDSFTAAFTQVTGDLTYSAGDNFRVDFKNVRLGTQSQVSNLILSTNGEDFWPVSEIISGAPLWRPAG